MKKAHVLKGKAVLNGKAILVEIEGKEYNVPRSEYAPEFIKFLKKNGAASVTCIMNGSNLVIDEYDEFCVSYGANKYAFDPVEIKNVLKNNSGDVLLAKDHGVYVIDVVTKKIAYARNIFDFEDGVGSDFAEHFSTKLLSDMKNQLANDEILNVVFALNDESMVVTYVA